MAIFLVMLIFTIIYNKQASLLKSYPQKKNELSEFRMISYTEHKSLSSMTAYSNGFVYVFFP